MHRAGLWKFVGVLVLGLGALLVMFGLNLMPPQEVAMERGSIAPWRMTWGMIWITVAMAMVLAWFLFTVGKKNQT